LYPIFGISARIEIGAITAFPPGTLLPPKGECAEIAQGLERMRPGITWSTYPDAQRPSQWRHPVNDGLSPPRLGPFLSFARAGRPTGAMGGFTRSQWPPTGRRANKGGSGAVAWLIRADFWAPDRRDLDLGFYSHRGVRVYTAISTLKPAFGSPLIPLGSIACGGDY